MSEINSSTINLLNKAYKDSSSGGSLRSLNWGRKDTGGGFSRKRQATGKKSRSYKNQTPDLKNPKTKKRNGRGNSGKGRNLKPVTKNAPPPAQNISKFGGGLKGNNAITFKGIAAGAASAGRATASLPKVIGTGLIQSTKANPALALIVGNLIVWKKNIELLRGIYNHKSPPLGLMYPTTRNLVNIGTPANYTGGQSAGVDYQMKFWDLAATGSNNFQPLYRNPPDYLYTWHVSFTGKITGYQLFKPSRQPISYATFKANGRDFRDAYYLEIYTQGGSRTETINLTNNWGIEPHSFERADGRVDTGGNPPPIAAPIYSSGGLASPTATAVLPQEVNANKPIAFKPPSVLPKVKPEEEANKKTPTVEPVPATVPELEPLPDDDVEKLPIIPLDRPTIITNDPVKPTEQKKPASATVTTTRYATPQELEDIRKVTEENRKKTDISIDGDEYKLTGLPTIEESQEKNRQSVTPQYTPTVITKRTLLTKPILPVVPTVERSTTTETSTGIGTNFPVIAPPVPGYKLREPKAPAPTVTPVDGCKKGCGGTPVTLSQNDSNNLAKAADGISQAAILAIVKNTNEAVRHAKYGLEAVQKFGETAWKVTQADKVMAGVTMALTIHNAMMLSNNLLSTVSEATNMALDALNIRSAEDTPIDFGTLVKDKIAAVLTSILGEANYAALTARTAKANRIYQSSINLLDTTRNLFDSAQSIAEVSARYTGEIGNALRNAGVVAEDAYEEMIEKMNPQSKGLLGLQKFTDGIEAVESAFDSVTQISSNVIEIRDNISQLETEKTALIAEIDEDKKDRGIEREMTKINSRITAEVASIDFEAAPPGEE